MIKSQNNNEISINAAIASGSFEIYCTDCFRFVPADRFGDGSICALCEHVRDEFMMEVAAETYNRFER